jgi:ASC-1-like (ASCH) protein
MKRTLVFAKTDKHHFDAILRGAKTVETRAGSPMYQKIQAGDTLILKCNGRVAERTVKAVRRFKDVADIYSSAEFSKVAPDVTSIEEAEKMYYGFTGYRERIAKYGILAFYL